LKGGDREVRERSIRFPFAELVQSARDEKGEAGMRFSGMFIERKTFQVSRRKRRVSQLTAGEGDQTAVPSSTLESAPTRKRFCTTGGSLSGRERTFQKAKEGKAPLTKTRLSEETSCA